MPTVTIDLPAGTEDDPVCVGVPYPAVVDCAPGDLVEWVSAVGDGQQANAVFSNPNGRETLVTFLVQGSYSIFARCRTPI